MTLLVGGSSIVIGVILRNQTTFNKPVLFIFEDRNPALAGFFDSESMFVR